MEVRDRELRGLEAADKVLSTALAAGSKARGTQATSTDQTEPGETGTNDTFRVSVTAKLRAKAAAASASAVAEWSGEEFDDETELYLGRPPSGRGEEVSHSFSHLQPLSISLSLSLSLSDTRAYPFSHFFPCYLR